MLTILLVVLIVSIALGGGGWGYKRYGWVGGAPGGLILLILALLYLTGHIFVH